MKKIIYNILVAYVLVCSVESFISILEFLIMQFAPHFISEDRFMSFMSSPVAAALFTILSPKLLLGLPVAIIGLFLITPPAQDTHTKRANRILGIVTTICSILVCLPVLFPVIDRFLAVTCIYSLSYIRSTGLCTVEIFMSPVLMAVVLTGTIIFVLRQRRT